MLPDLFAENQGMVGTGQLPRRRVRGLEILAKHDEDYMPKEVADALKEQGVYGIGRQLDCVSSWEIPRGSSAKKKPTGAAPPAYAGAANPR